ncbi:MAG: peptidase S16 [Planctomycetaceae bacterium]|nr:peptidase S16 [Planctomycetaceae bacterium]
MFELPLFPLNTVLFPGMPINLHIFEPRYKLMIEQCIQNDEPFGVVLIHKGTEASGPLAEPHPIGCTAQITQVERLDDGRMNILAVGGERFQIRSLNHTEPYLVGTVELVPLDEPSEPVIEQAGHRLRPWVERYLGVLAQVAENVEFDPAGLPDDPLALAYLAATLLQIPSDQKQTLLAADGAADLLTTIRSLYRREVALLSAIVARDTMDTQGLFSLN